MLLITNKEELPPRQSGQLRGMFEVSDDFDAPLPADILKNFYGDDTEVSDTFS